MPRLCLKLLIRILELPTKSLINHLDNIGSEINTKTVIVAEVGYSVCNGRRFHSR